MTYFNRLLGLNADAPFISDEIKWMTANVVKTQQNKLAYEVKLKLLGHLLGRKVPVLARINLWSDASKNQTIDLATRF